MEVHLNDLKGYDHCLVYADKGEAASLCSSIESECIEEIMMEGSGKPVTTLPDHIRNNYSPLNSNSGPTMYKGETFHTGWWPDNPAIYHANMGPLVHVDKLGMHTQMT